MSWLDEPGLKEVHGEFRRRGHEHQEQRDAYLATAELFRDEARRADG